MKQTESTRCIQYRVREGATGILTLSDKKGVETYLPHYDMDAARDLLLEFQELKGSDGKALKDNYHQDGENWFPAIVSQLYWYVFFPWVKYEPLARRWLAGEADYRIETPGNFGVLMSHLCRRKGFPLRQHLHNFAWRLSNAVTVRRCTPDVLFFRFALRDFRSVEIRSTMDGLGIRYLQAVPAPSTLNILKNFFRTERFYYFPQPNKTISGNCFRISYDLAGLPSEKCALFSAAIALLEETLTTCIHERTVHRSLLARSGVKAFYGFDDVNTYFFPLFFAARSLGLPTLGHQHGAYVKRHAGYMWEGLSRESVQWFDKVLVWGRYWRDKMLRDAPVHPPDRWVIGANKLKMPSLPAGETPACPTRPSNVLIPYEFLADTAAIGRYMTRLVELGYTVWFRARSDEPLENQIEAYQLSPGIRSQLRMATGALNEEFLAGIDVVAGTMTTLIYELLPAGKIIWYLETPYRHLYDLVEEGLAHLIRIEDIRPPGEMPSRSTTPTLLPAEDVFGSEPLESVLRSHLLPLLQ